MAELEGWQMWRQRCALARCSPEVQQDLRGFAHSRYRNYLQKLGPDAMERPSAEQAWHWFETHLALGRQREAKSYKEWLFVRGEGAATLDRVQGGATLLMRDVVREQLRREYSPRWMRSLDAPLPVGQEHTGSGPTPTERIPMPDTPLDEVERREFAAMAAAGSAAAFSALSHRERIAIGASLAELSLAHPVVVAAAQCAKSSLFNAHHTGLRKLADAVDTRYPREPPPTRAEIAILLLEHIRLCILDWLRVENRKPELFQLITGGL